MREPQALLDNPIWSALTTAQAHFAEGDALARRYRPDVSPFGALGENSPEAFEALEHVVGADTVVLQFLDQPAVPRPWQIVLEIPCLQMICALPPARRTNPASNSGTTLRKLTSSDIPQMLTLTKLTEPGPFREQTIEMGTYLGLHTDVDGKETLIAMAGERMHMTGFTEVSAVCTHPDFRGRGYGNTLVAEVSAGIAERGETPILHVKAENQSAVRVYQRLGFVVRTPTILAMIKRAAS